MPCDVGVLLSGNRQANSGTRRSDLQILPLFVCHWSCVCLVSSGDMLPRRSEVVPSFSRLFIRCCSRPFGKSHYTSMNDSYSAAFIRAAFRSFINPTSVRCNAERTQNRGRQRVSVSWVVFGYPEYSGFVISVPNIRLCSRWFQGIVFQNVIKSCKFLCQKVLRNVGVGGLWRQSHTAIQYNHH